MLFLARGEDRRTHRRASIFETLRFGHSRSARQLVLSLGMHREVLQHAGESRVHGDGRSRLAERFQLRRESIRFADNALYNWPKPSFGVQVSITMVSLAVALKT